ncbi:hypothetical protein [Streptomyces sp. NPDC046860]|uniref:hypothetical protein n=1 Tax=Streptomyces sp. NPDC046860 TaxID=3154495 RepID=UPI0033EA6647
MARPLSALGHAVAGVASIAAGFGDYMAAQKKPFVDHSLKTRGDQRIKEGLGRLEQAVRSLR